jgi:hypothetical protein
MIRKLLALIAGGTPSPKELAQKLGVSLPELEAMLGQLTRLGYLQDFAREGDDEKSAGCSGCAVRKGCHAGAGRHLWTLTTKGRRAAEMASDHLNASA